MTFTKLVTKYTVFKIFVFQVVKDIATGAEGLELNSHAGQSDTMCCPGALPCRCHSLHNTTYYRERNKDLISNTFSIYAIRTATAARSISVKAYFYIFLSRFWILLQNRTFFKIPHGQIFSTYTYQGLGYMGKAYLL